MKKILLFLMLIATKSFSQDTITTVQAKQFIGKEVWVKGKIASVKAASEGNVNYINVDKAFPNNVFTVAVSTKYLERMKINLATAKGKTILVKGKIEADTKDQNAVPQISNPQQLKIK